MFGAWAPLSVRIQRIYLDNVLFSHQYNKGVEARVGGMAEVSQSQPATAAGEKLPKLSAADFRAYNKMADHMELFVRF